MGKSFDWKATLGAVAPALATALGGPMAGMATKIIADELGLDGGANADVASAVASGDPDVLLKLKNAEQTYELKRQELGVELKRIDAMDRDSARSVAISKGVVVHAILSGVFVVGYFLIFSAFLYAIKAGIKIEPEMLALVSALLGIMTAAVQQIMNFWFGSSSGSKQKTVALAEFKA